VIHSHDFVSILGDQIIELRAKGMSFKAIAKEIPCSLSTVAYFLSDNQKEKTAKRNRTRRQRILQELKETFGGECAVCGYKTCITALEFDHLAPSTKTAEVSALRNHAASAKAEAEKCILLCCRCHRERHAGLLDIGAYLEPSE